MKAILFANTDWYLFNFRLNIARALREKGVEVVLLSPPGNYVAQMQAEGFRWLELPMSRKGMNPFTELKTLWRIKKIYRDENPDIVHHFTIKCVLYGSIAAHLNGIRAIVNAVTGLGYVFSAPGPKGSLLRLMARTLYRYALRNTQVIFQNTEDRQTFINLKLLDEGSAHLIPGSGIHLGKFTPTPEPAGEPVVMFAARMLWEKGVGDFVEAAKMLKAEGVQARFVLVGDTYKDNPSAVPPAQLEKWNCEGIIEWWGWHDDMAQVLAQSSIVCLPTYYKEGVPRILTEAAASGRPLVSSDITGCREIVKEGRNGWMVPPQNPPMLASALHKLIESPADRERMGQESRKIAENHFAEEKIIHKTLGVYSKLGFSELLTD